MKGFIIKNTFLVLILFLANCARSIPDPAIYHGVEGHDYSKLPIPRQSPQRPPAVQQQAQQPIPAQSAPDYYYRQNQAAPYPYQQQPYQQQPYPQQPYQQQPYPQQNPYAGGGGYPPQAGSRFYNNPYAIEPQRQYPYYDSDYYYVPPKYYGVGNQ